MLYYMWYIPHCIDTSLSTSFFRLLAFGRGGEALSSLKSTCRRTSPVHPPSQTHGLDLKSWSARLRFDPLAGMRAGASMSGNCRPSSDAAGV